MYIFILLLSAWVLFECVFSLWLSFCSCFSKFVNILNYYIKAENKMIKHFCTKKILLYLGFWRKAKTSRSYLSESSIQIWSSFCYLKLKYYGLSLWASQKWVLLVFTASDIFYFLWNWFKVNKLQYMTLFVSSWSSIDCVNIYFFSIFFFNTFCPVEKVGVRLWTERTCL